MSTDTVGNDDSGREEEYLDQAYVQGILDARLGGESAASLARRYGVSRETIVAITVEATGLPREEVESRSRFARAMAEAAELSYAVRLAERLLAKGKMTRAELQDRLGVGSSLAAEVHTELSPAALARIVTHGGGSHPWSKGEAEAELRRISAAESGGGHVVARVWNALADPVFPRALTMSLEYGSWYAFADAAGLAPDPARSRVPRETKSAWSRDEAIGYLSRAFASGASTTEDYTEWARSVPGSPSATSIRNKIKPMTWAQARREYVAGLGTRIGAA